MSGMQLHVVSQGYPLWVGWYAESERDVRFGAVPIVAWRVDGATVCSDAVSTSALGAEERVRERWRRAAEIAWQRQFGTER